VVGRKRREKTIESDCPILTSCGSDIARPETRALPTAIPFSNALDQPPSSTSPFLCPPFFCHSPFRPFSFLSATTKTQPVFLWLAENDEQRRSNLIVPSLLLAVPILRARRRARSRPRFLSPTRWTNRDRQPPHFSALHFSAIPPFAPFRFFRLSPKHNRSFCAWQKTTRKDDRI